MHCIGGRLEVGVTMRLYVGDMPERGMATLTAWVSGMLYDQEDFDPKERLFH